MKGAELFVRCLENEGVDRIFGIPGEENIDVMDVLLGSPILKEMEDAGKIKMVGAMYDMKTGEVEFLE